MAIFDWKLSNKIFTPIFVQNKIFLSGGSDKQININLFIIFISKSDLIIVGYARIGLRLLVFIPFFIMVFLIMNRIIEREAIDISINTCSNNLSIIVRYSNILNIIG